MSRDQHQIEQAIVAAGAFTMGDSSGDRNAQDGEIPCHRVELDEFEIDATAVTRADFERFVGATTYVTDAERYGSSAVFHLAVAAPKEDILGQSPSSPWWLEVRGANWRHPGGTRSDLAGLAHHPVTHISWNDANAYCSWSERALPTEAQWECAARGGLEGKKYPWGDAEIDEGGWRANIWQGHFPHANTMHDGYLTTAPVRSFAPNGLGMWQPIGNVWEWCADWFSPNYYRSSPLVNPQGPARGHSRVLRGGSYLCHNSYCNRYRNSARSHNTPDSTMGNAGFRTVSPTPGVPLGQPSGHAPSSALLQTAPARETITASRCACG